MTLKTERVKPWSVQPIIYQPMVRRPMRVRKLWLALYSEISEQGYARRQASHDGCAARWLP